MAPPPAAARSLPPDDDDADADGAPVDPGWEDAWNSELDRRIADVREGRVQPIPREEVTAAIRAKYGWT
jgi:putative addiction module component (TIGR02574 family)